VPLDRRISLTLSEEHDTYSTRAPNSTISLTANFSAGRLDVTSTLQGGTGTQQNVQLAQSPPGRYGMGYVASVSPSGNAGLNGTFYYRSRYGDYSLDYGAQLGPPFSDAVRVNGGVAFIDGGIYAAPPVTGSYALVEVPNTPDVRVYFQNQDVGKTDRRGRLLVTDLLANYGNELRIDDSAAPLDTSINALQQLIAPPERGGAVVRFAATRVHAIHGKVRVSRNGSIVIPSYGQLTIKNDAGDDISIVGASGEFYFENVAPGTYAATVLFAHGTCEFPLNVPAVNGVLDDMGTLTCDMH
jgi:outer membrane usher protein